MIIIVVTALTDSHRSMVTMKDETEDEVEKAQKYLLMASLVWINLHVLLRAGVATANWHRIIRIYGSQGCARTLQITPVPLVMAPERVPRP